MVTATVQKDGYETALTTDLTSWEWSDSGGVADHDTDFAPNQLFIGDWSAPARHFNGVIRIGPLAINNGEVINSADLKFRISNVYKDVVFDCRAVLDSVTFGEPGAGNLTYGNTLTTANVTSQMSVLYPVEYRATDNWIPTDPIMSIDVTSQLQEVVNHANWVSGGHVTFVLIRAAGSTGPVRFFADEHATQDPPSMDYELSTDPAILGISGTNVINGNEILNTATTIDVNVANVTATVTEVAILKGTEFRTQTILNTDPNNLSFTFSQGVTGALGYGTGYTLRVTFDDASQLTYTVVLGSVDQYVVIDDVSTIDSASFGFQADPPIAIGDIFEYQATSALGDTVNVNGKGEPTLSGSGEGYDTFEARYFSKTARVWSDSVFTVSFDDINYFAENPITPILGSGVIRPFIDTLDDPLVSLVGNGILQTFSNASFQDSPNTGFDSVNSPSIKIIDGAKSLSLYANRDNTGEFQFLESGVPVDLFKSTMIELKIGNNTFSDSNPSYSDKFTKAASGKLTVEFGELGLPAGTYPFYFIIYTPGQPNGVVWNDKSQYTLELKLA